jgi:hypothetical protein
VSRRVRIGTCSGPADAALVRSVFAARGLPVVVGAEHHSSMLAGLGGFLSLDIWVDEADAEEAHALLHDLRSSDASNDGACEVDDGACEVDDGACEVDDGACEVDDGEAAADGESAAEPDDAGDAIALGPSGTAFQQQLDRRRRTGLALLLGCCITFGTAHMSTGAWSRGIALAALELVGILRIGAGDAVGCLAIAAAVAFDLLGALWRIWSASSTALPVARLRDRS